MKEVIRIFPSPLCRLPFYIRMSGISYCDGTYDIYRKNSPVTVVEYVISGEGTICVDGNEYIAEKDDIYIIHSYTEHEYRSDDKNPWVKMFLNISGSLCEEILKQYGLENTVVISGSDAYKQFTSLYNTSLKTTVNENKIYDECAIEFHRLAEILGKQNMVDDNDEISLIREHIDRALDRIVSNAELAELIFRSEDYVIKQFAKKYGKTPYDYQLNRKMSVAKRLLSETRLTVGQIAEMIGYKDHMYFSTIFKKKCGMSPLQYRKSNQ